MLLDILPDILSQERILIPYTINNTITITHTITHCPLSQEDIGKIEIVVLFLGSNDASMASTNPEQAVPLEEFGDNLLRIISMLLSKVRDVGWLLRA